jgi:hypothetical protein
VSGAGAKKKRRRRAREGGGGSGAARAGGADGARVGGERTAPLGGGGRADAARAGGADGARTPRPPSRFEVRDGVARPQPIWSPFPLTELGMAAGLAIFVAGLLGDGRRATWLLTIAVVVLAVVVVELCLREHFAGYRSHTLLLTVLPVAVLDGAIVRLLGATLRGPLVLATALALAGALGWWLQARFRAARERAAATSQA